MRNQHILKKMYEKGVNVRQLAEAIGVSAATMSRILNGRGEPSYATLMALCEFLGTSSYAMGLSAYDPSARDFSEHRRVAALKAANHRAANQLMSDLLDGFGHTEKDRTTDEDK